VPCVKVVAFAGEISEGGGGGTSIVKYTTTEAPLDPAELEADTAHKYVAPFCSVGQLTEFVVTFCDTTVPPPTCVTTTEYAVAPGETFQVRVGVRVVTVVPGGEAAPGDNPVGTAGADGVATLKLEQPE